MKSIILSLSLFFFLLAGYQVNAQVSVNTDGTDPDGSAMLDVKSTIKGMLIPRMSATERLAIPSPAQGLLVYDTDVNCFYHFDGVTWIQMCTQNFSMSGDTIFINGNIYFNDDLWEDLHAPLLLFQGSGINAAGVEKFLDNGAGSPGIWNYSFDRTNPEELFYQVQLPHNWKEGTDLKAHIHWSTKTAGTGNVVWGIEYSWANVNGTFSNSTIVTAVGTVAGPKIQQVTPLATLSGTGKTTSSVLLIRLFRDAGNVQDTYNADAFGLQLDLHYRIGRIGSESEY